MVVALVGVVCFLPAAVVGQGFCIIYNGNDAETSYSRLIFQASLQGETMVLKMNKPSPSQLQKRMEECVQKTKTNIIILCHGADAVMCTSSFKKEDVFTAIGNVGKQAKIDVWIYACSCSSRKQDSAALELLVQSGVRIHLCSPNIIWNAMTTTSAGGPQIETLEVPGYADVRDAPDMDKILGGLAQGKGKGMDACTTEDLKEFGAEVKTLVEQECKRRPVKLSVLTPFDGYLVVPKDRAPRQCDLLDCVILMEDETDFFGGGRPARITHQHPAAAAVARPPPKQHARQLRRAVATMPPLDDSTRNLLQGQSRRRRRFHGANN